ncbi:2-oxoglutarate dehydrogenase E1 component [Marininema mesophilum]|uniref:2-oxoglutarate dehydrogenase E1 component n=1 Tax=Marininema mesophilum TaxID=1048340 RepID=A0A1H2Y0R9_9BACL|nr:2-oxoglutarate dehydrogenase E1 component [Marininema mesophilum]SDW98294.1 2-oxoglutarate dehydrogenase E1 component [Marininema mesophilum]
MEADTGNPWQRFHGPNLGYAQELYEQYLEDPSSVEKPMQEWFKTYGAPPGMGGAGREPVTGLPTTVEVMGNASYLQKVVATEKLVNSIRIHGHMGAKLDPLNYHEPDKRLLQPEAFGLTNEDLETIPAEVILTDPPKGVKTAQDAVCHLRDLYTRTIAFQFSHVHDPIEREWLYKRVESGLIPRVNATKKAEVLKRLIAVDEFEKFLHRTFVGQKRFSVEGLDMLVPLMDEIIHCSVNEGVRSINIGMAHRGRLNVLAHILGKPYEKIFSEFHHAPNKDLVPSEGSMGINSGYTGDVKYHLGADCTVESAQVALANNPSHLEYVNPVVEGYTRAAQEERDARGYPVLDVSRALTILVHGDAAFPGEGVVAETLNFDRLPGFQTGGSIHIIANNLLGFTTDSSDSRSTRYASDLAKGYEIPIVHINADDPEACLAAVRLACEYRTKFQKDFLIDLIGYRRFGHNEIDDPTSTQPLLYKKVHNHPTLRTSYAKTLITDGVLTEEDVKAAEKEVLDRLQEAYKVAKGKRKNGNGQEASSKAPKLIGELKTGVDIDLLRDINEEMLKRPEEFNSHPKLEKVLQRRKGALDGEGAIDWPLAESLAIGSILADGTPIRFTGQDSERGTFAQRNWVLHDPESGKKFCPLHQLPQAKASFAVHNSPLTEAAVIGFEYGYNVYSPETLVIWEAQYGDFANAGQVIMDQFVSAGRAKWGQLSSLVIFLPHGYEGQGPEHSSGRLERFLQMAAENNWTVANVTNAAQYFHLLRRQAAIVNTEDARPLILMTPKSLLRSKRTVVNGEALQNGSFQFVLEQSGWVEKASDIKRLILASGKVAVDLEEMAEKEGRAKDVHVLRVEQLYPFPEKEIKAILKKYSQAKDLVWVQEEPRNMGAWTYMESRLRGAAPRGAKVSYIGRPDRSSTAEGKPDIHEAEKGRILREALKI